MSRSPPFKLAVICGGPSQERGISLNSARSIMDHLKGFSIEIIPLYVDCRKQFYRISPAQLYCNTPADFDFKLREAKLDGKSLKDLLTSSDLVFPIIHGAFGEDGELQQLLEQYNVPYVGHSSMNCQRMFRKDQAAKILKLNNFATLPQALLSSRQQDLFQIIEKFFHHYKLKRAIVKPTVGGSSIDVYSVKTPQDAYVKMQSIFDKQPDAHVLLEPFCEGKEFTIVVLENLHGEPVALIPTEVDLSYAHNQIFDYRKKYLPTNQAAYHTPPRFSQTIVEQIRLQAEQIFKLFEMRDFVRLDGWVVENGKLYFTDINPLSGLEQNSFFFRQASILGMTHGEALQYILKSACFRYGLQFPSHLEIKSNSSKVPVYVLFGSHNAERQVSLMSGTNVWLKLLQSQQYAPIPFLYDYQRNIWQLPYSVTLHHTVEEIYASCLSFEEIGENSLQLKKSICHKLGADFRLDQQPRKMSLNQFLDAAIISKAFVFIALHGGEGENGVLQKNLENYQIPFNGSNSAVSALCMDKYFTGLAIQSLQDPDLQIAPKKCLHLNLLNNCYKILWSELTQELGSQQLIVKPRSDGCSAGIVLLQSCQDLELYCRFINQKTSVIPPFSFANQAYPIEMSLSFEGEFLFEPYIETDSIIIQHDQLHSISKQGWIELTVGVLEQAGQYHALSPSITITEGAVLSLEEKFQGGTGINLTPPPENILSVVATQKIKQLVKKAAQALGIQNYARLDIFFNRLTEKMILIEANTLPGLTPSTVIYHQGLAEETALTPLDLLEKMISSKLNDCSLR